MSVIRFIPVSPDLKSRKLFTLIRNEETSVYENFVCGERIKQKVQGTKYLRTDYY